MAQFFNPEQFMEAAIQGANDTKITPCPVGEWHGQVEKVEAKAQPINNGERAGEVLAKFLVYWEIMDEEPRRQTGREKVRVRQEILLDLTDEGMIDMGKGKNVRLGKFREAVGLNDPNVAFNPMQSVGRTGVVVVGHRPDPKDSTIVYDEVTAVRKG